MKFLTAVLLGVLLIFAAGILLLSRFDVAATSPPGVVDRLAIAVRNASIRRESSAATPAAPPGDPTHGAEHYREHCTVCHGGAGKPEEFAKDMNPAPPPLDSPWVRKLSDPELTWIIKKGIRMTGMPAFGGSHSDAEIADIVAFVRQLPQGATHAEEETRGASPGSDR
jgi:mono/diheme cytochrome c family protein